MTTTPSSQVAFQKHYDPGSDYIVITVSGLSRPLELRIAPAVSEDGPRWLLPTIRGMIERQVRDGTRRGAEEWEAVVRAFPRLAALFWRPL